MYITQDIEQLGIPACSKVQNEKKNSLNGPMWVQRHTVSPQIKRHQWVSTFHRKIQNIKLRRITSDLTMQKDNIEWQRNPYQLQSFEQ